MEKINLRLFNRILAEHDHLCTQKQIEKRPLLSRGQGFQPNLAKKVCNSNSFVQKYLIQLIITINNNGTYKLFTQMTMQAPLKTNSTVALSKSPNHKKTTKTQTPNLYLR